MRRKGFVNIILVIIIVVLTGAVGYLAWNKKSTYVSKETVSNEKTGDIQKPEQTESKTITLTSPKNNMTYDKGTNIRIAGKTKPGYYIQAYANYLEKDLKCLTKNSFSTGGAGQADANGNFDFKINDGAVQIGKNTLVVVALDPAINLVSNICFSDETMSDVVTYIYTGKIINP